MATMYCVLIFAQSHAKFSSSVSTLLEAIHYCINIICKAVFNIESNFDARQIFIELCHVASLHFVQNNKRGFERFRKTSHRNCIVTLVKLNLQKTYFLIFLPYSA